MTPEGFSMEGPDGAAPPLLDGALFAEPLLDELLFGPASDLPPS